MPSVVALTTLWRIAAMQGRASLPGQGEAGRCRERVSLCRLQCLEQFVETLREVFGAGQLDLASHHKGGLPHVQFGDRLSSASIFFRLLLRP